MRWHRQHNGGLTLAQGSLTTHQLKNRTWSNGRFLTSIKTAGIEDPVKTTRQKPHCGFWGTLMYLKLWQIVFSCLVTKIFPAHQMSGNKQKREVPFYYHSLLLHFSSPIQLAVTPSNSFFFLLSVTEDLTSGKRSLLKMSLAVRVKVFVRSELKMQWVKSAVCR